MVDQARVDAVRKRNLSASSTAPVQASQSLNSTRRELSDAKLSKLSVLAAFETLERVTSETPEGTSRTESPDEVYELSQSRGTSETPEGTSRSSIAPLNVQAESVSVELDNRELEIP